MRHNILHSVLWTLLAATANAQAAPTYLLQSGLAKGDIADVTVSLEVGGDLVIRKETEETKLPLSVTGQLRYQEQVLAWSANSADVARSLRAYETATATIQVDKAGLERELPGEAELVVAEIRAGRSALNGAKQPLSREQLDLVNVVGNTLGIDRLLPSRALAEGDSWDHDGATIGALLGMDHVAVCEVRSVVTGESHGQVQLRLAGTVHGTIDGAPTEIQLRGAYLFHLGRQRITKFNLAIQESRSASEIVPGLDVIAKVSIVVAPAARPRISKADAKLAGNLAEPLDQALQFESAEEGFRFRHDASWYVTAEQSDLLSLRCLQNGDLTAHCNVTTLPARSAGRETAIKQFENDVRDSLGENFGAIVAATEWSTDKGHNCLGVIAAGKVSGVPVQWRYYLISSVDLPRVSIAVTVEQSSLEQFADADRQLVDTLELFPNRTTETARKSLDGSAR